ncbi:RNA-directed DNA polymerase [Klebsiella pneumoniae]|uniref:reverse transcriptase domain-containing protein n=1 Tax=Klebsiella pneumoniae TaxID=573 RepID=UPI001C81FB00|nr:reverse transcriptase domain-containing protein [Klebsiella pneumoniae]MBX4519618.1 RNA-directed DNA polymerase [Klebsiella pneumoniae]
MMNMNPTQCNELSAEHDERTKWHNDDLRDAQRLDEAWAWLRESRKTAPANADIWHLRQRWPACREAFLRKLQSGEHHLSPMLVVGTRRQVMWPAEDALALKWVALSITPSIPVHEKCEHVKGHGGGRSSVRRISQSLTENGYRWVCRTDIKGYYGAINKETLLLQLREHITHPAYLTILTQYIHYSVEEGGEFYTPEKGIARGCALSPLMGALHLWAVDNYFAHQHKIYYGRYMDDFVILTYSRWQLRKQVKQLNKYLASLGFEKHPDKTFIGKVSRGFDWLGAWLTDKGVVGIAPRALTNHREKVRRLSEQTRHWSKTKQARRVSDYRARWKIWGAMVGLLSSAPSYALIEVIRPGGADATWRVPVNLTIPGTTASGSNLDTNNLGAPASVVRADVMPPDGSCMRVPFHQAMTTTSDGFYGIPLGPDLVLGISGTMTGSTQYTSGRVNGSATLADNGVTASQTYPLSRCPWAAPTTTTSGTQTSVTMSYPSSFTGSVFIHAGPNAVAGTYNVVPLVFAKFSANTWGSPPTVSIPLPSAVRVVLPTSCTVNIDTPTVQFGQIDASVASGQLMRVQQSTVTTSCTSVDDGGSGTNRVSVTLSAQGTVGDVSNSLALQDASNTVKMANIFGLIGNRPAGQCTPDVNNFDFVGTPFDLGTVGVGSTGTILTWSLCSNGTGALGIGHASAVLTVSWP